MASKKIIEIAAAHDLLVVDVSAYVKNFQRRWYDVDEELCTAMEYFKVSSLEIQKKIAIEIINFLCEIEN